MKMKKGLWLALLVTGIIAIVAVSISIASDKQSTVATQEGAIQWISVEDLPAKQAEEPRKVIVDLYTDWCGWCKKMDAGTFADPNVAKYIGEKFYAVKFNAETKTPVVFKGKTYQFETNGNRGVNGLAVELGSFNGRLGYPTIVILDESLNKLEANPGYKEAPSMLQLAKFYGDNHYKTINFQQFEQSGQ